MYKRTMRSPNPVRSAISQRLRPSIRCSTKMSRHFAGSSANALIKYTEHFAGCAVSFGVTVRKRRCLAPGGMSTFQRCSPPRAEPIRRKIRRNLEQEASQIADSFRSVELQKLHIRLLRDVPCLLFRTQLGGCESEQRAVMLAKKPRNIDSMRLLSRIRL